MLKRIFNRILCLSIVELWVVKLWHLFRDAQLERIKKHASPDLFKVIHVNALDIMSDFPIRDSRALEVITQKVLTQDVVVVEVGSWKGMSTSVIAKTVKPFNGKVFAVDHWQGNEGVPEHEKAKGKDIFLTFRHNIKTLGVSEVIYPLVMDSNTAVSIFKDESLDMVFIDADHRYSFVKKDIEMWLPKVKQGGIIAGHDCEEKYNNFGEFIKEIDQHLEEDVIVGVCHPGVVKALHDLFKDDFNIEPHSKVWWRRK